MKPMKVNELPYEQQAAVILVELLLQLADGRRDKASLNYVINDLIRAMDINVEAASVLAVAKKVGEFGVHALPGYTMTKVEDDD